MNGFELREIVFKDPNLKDLCTPYVFLTTSGENEDHIKQAYSLSVQGYFKKHADLVEYEVMLNDLLRYWKQSIKPVAYLSSC